MTVSVTVLTAAEFAKEAHLGQMRKFPEEPYFEHCRRVALATYDLCGSYDIMAAAYLHDVLEDTNVPEAELREGFGSLITDLVVECTDVYTAEEYPKHNRATRKQWEALRYRDLSTGAKIIKRADINDNLNGITLYDPDFAVPYLAEKSMALRIMGFGGNK